MAPAPTEAVLTSCASSADFIDKLPDDILTKILLRVPTPAALVHAAVTSKSWRRVIATRKFLAEYRQRHKSSPFLGLYIPPQIAGPPWFVMPNSIHCADEDTLDSHLRLAAVKAADIGGVSRYKDHRLHDAGDHAFIQRRLGVHAGCRLLDCHNSRLLLTRGDEALEMRSPLARESVVLPFPPDVDRPDSLQACLLQGHNEVASSFRVICLQHHRKCRRNSLVVGVRLRAVEYDSSRKSWLAYPWETRDIAGMPEEAMHAGHLIFWKLRGQTPSSLLFDTRTMKFSVHDLPSECNFAIGEIEDDKCCLVESYGCVPTLIRVWQLEENLKWKLDKTAPLEQVLGKHSGYYRVSAITNGILLLCSTSKNQHFVVDLNSFSLKENFDFQGVFAWPMQMPWPPTFNAAGGLGLDQESPCPSLGVCFSADPSQEANKAISSSIDSMCSVPGTNCSSQDMALATAPPADILPTSSLGAEYIVYRRRMALTTTSSSRCPQQGTSCSNQDIVPATVPPADILPTSSLRTEYIVYRRRMDLTTTSSSRCPQQSIQRRKRPRESEGSPKGMGLRRRNWNPSPKYLQAMGQRRLHRKRTQTTSARSIPFQDKTKEAPRLWAGATGSQNRST